MPPQFADHNMSPEITPKSEPRDSTFPTPDSRASAQPRGQKRPLDNERMRENLQTLREHIRRRQHSIAPRPEHEVDTAQFDLLDEHVQHGLGPSILNSFRPHRTSGDSLPDARLTLNRDSRAESSRRREQEQPSNPFDNPAYTALPGLREDQLDDDQRKIVGLVMKGHNVCSPAEAGTGKSVTCKYIVDMLKTTKNRRNVSIVTPSGTSAVNVGALTLHSFFGLGREANKGIEDYTTNMKPTVKERLRKLNTLIIDEISMVSSETFDRMDQMARAARQEPEKSFGGIQLVVFGDFCQLPPVKPWEHCFECGRKREAARLTPPARGRGRGRAKQGPKVWRCPKYPKHEDILDSDKMWAFKSTNWDHMGFNYVQLKQVHRQLDPVFLEVLRNARLGEPFDAEQIALLRDHTYDVSKAVQLVSRKDDAKRINARKLQVLASKEYRYKCQDHFDWKEDAHPELADLNKRSWETLDALSDHPYEPVLCLKQGQSVILLRNLDVEKCLVNGSQGVIDHFAPYDEADRPQYNRNRADEFSSRPRADPINDFMYSGNYTMIPVVKFNNHEELVPIYPDCSVSERGYEQPHSLLMRTQIPLLPGWAITIHKAQGMTLDRAVVDLGHCFTCGMAYVALSRVRTLEGLKVLGIDTHENKPMDEEVRAFLEEKFPEDSAGSVQSSDSSSS